MFPEKLVFDNGTYRTTMPSEVLSLLLNVNKGFNGVNKKRTAKKTRQSCQVSPNVQFSNQLKKKFQLLFELKPFLPVKLIDIQNRKHQLRVASR